MPTAPRPPFSPRSRRKLPHDPLRVVGYIRASKERQQLTPQAQLDALRRWCGTHDAVMVAHFVDQNVSGATEPEDRPGMMKAVAALVELKAGTLLVVVRDRIARDVGVIANVEKAVSRAGAVLRSTDGIGELAGPSGFLQKDMTDVISAHERRMIAWRTREVLSLKKQRGELTGSAPWGFRVGRDGVHLVENPKEQEAIAVARRLRRRGRSLRAICATLDARGVRSRSGGPLWPASIQSMLRSEVKVATMS